MQYLLHLADAAGQYMAVLTLQEAAVKAHAIDVVFDMIGYDNLDELAAADVVPSGQIDDLKALQQIIFDRDDQGLFIRDGISFFADNRELDPDTPMVSSFVAAERDGSKYMRCDLVITGGPQPEPKPALAGAGLSQSRTSAQLSEPAPAGKGTENITSEFARILFLHQIAIGFVIDVTKSFPELTDVMKYAESKGWIEVEVSKVAYKLTAEGRKVYDRYMSEAQDLIRRFDIYADVDVDSSGRARFDTGLGKDLRVPAFEMEGVDPFRARFLLGLIDGEWNQLSNWMELFEDQNWYAEIFDPVERAPSVEDIGRSRMESIIDQAKAVLRQQTQGY
jgi:hypothetical protein